MEINSTLAALSYDRARSATEPKEAEGATALMSDVASDFTRTLQAAETSAEAAMAGGADTHTMVEALAQTQLAIETAVTVRDKVVEAYQEILRMPV